MLSIIGEISAAKGGIEIIRMIRDLLKSPKPDMPVILEKLHDIHEKLSNAIDALHTAKDRIRELEEQLNVKEDLVNIENSLDYEVGGYYESKANKVKGVSMPLCPLCWKSDNKVIPLTKGATPGTFYCSIHKTSYRTAEYKEHVVERSRVPPTSTGWMAR